jgi:hypothetical protein
MAQVVVRFAAAAAITAVVNVGMAAAQATPKPAAPKAAPAAVAQTTPDGFHNATRLGGGRSLVGNIKDLKQLQRDMKRTAVRKNIQGALDAGGVSVAVRDQVMEILVAADPAVMKDGTFAVGDTMLWMGLKNKGKPDVLRNVRWSGRKPFPAWTFDVDDGETLYHFVLPKPCGNIALATTERSPKAIAAENARKAEEARRAEEARLAEEKRRADEAARLKAEEARRAEEARNRVPASCGVTASAVKAKGGWTISIDGTQSQAGGSPASSLVVQIAGPAGTPVSVDYNGKPVTELTLSAPFQASVLLRKPTAGIYTVRVASTAVNPKAPKSTCESTFTIVAADKVDFFVEGDFGKERRVREPDPAVVGIPLYGYCAPLFGVKFGADLALNEKWRLAPSGGIAFNLSDFGNTSLFAEAELNYWPSPKAFVGTGIGVWDFTHGDTVAPVWLFQGGTQVWEGGAKNNQMFFVISGRLFLDEMSDVSNNYQFWAGLRYIFK